MERRALNLPVVLLIGAMAAAAALLLILAADLTHFGDTWETLMNRREFTADALFAPHNEHIVVFPVIISQIVLALFGMTSAMPEFVVLTAGLVATAGLLFVYVRRRVDPWLALFAAVLLLFLGPAFEVLLWPYEIGFVGSVCFGLAMLLALERGDRNGDLIAALCLTLSLGFSSLGLSFLVGAAVAIALGPRERWLGRAYVAIVPAGLFAAWYLGWGHDAESHLTLRNVLASPRFVAEELAVGVGGLFGLGTDTTTGSPDPVWGRAILVALVVGIGVLAYRRRRQPGLPFPGLWPVAAAAATNWFLTAFNAFPGRDPSASRYQYATAVFVLAIAANLLRGIELSRRAVIIAGALTALAIAPNLVVLKNGRDFFYDQTVVTRSDIAALEIARETVSPEFQLSPEVAGTATLVDITAEKYFSATEEHGSPAYTPAELEAAPEGGRYQADVVLANALPISKETEAGGFASSAGAGCTVLPPGPKEEVALPPGTTRIEVAPGPEAGISLRRFAEGQYPVQTEAAPGGSVSALTIPADTVSRPWHLLVEAGQPARVCPPPG